ncbi:Ldh family oxidoreductase [uncultured Polaribacter sp.]|uniref:Ldh family oxidoreductase n=1 Tax=uncultured Polaribacter sp. TaxID=174711 RepID=UPI00259B4FF5|nr:Ldh family oxidoreductase [uncultured Polaribacter sp.]
MTHKIEVKHKKEYMTKTIQSKEMNDVLTSLFSKYGFTDEKAKLLAGVHTENTLHGVNSHGINRVPFFIEQLKLGLIIKDVEPEKVEEPVIEEVVVEKTPEEVSIIDKVSKQLSEMQVATELDKDKIKSLESIDSLEKLKAEFLNFKDIVARQMGTIGGGGEVRLEFLDDVQKSTAVVDGKFLKYSSSDGKFIGADASATELTGVTAGTVSASKAVVVDSSKDITGFRNLTITGDLTVEGSTTTIDSTTINVQTQFIFEGATDDAYETTLNVVDPTADRTITLPNISGTLPVLAVASTTQITATPEELNYSDGVTSNIQTQLDAKSTKAFAIAQAVALG